MTRRYVLWICDVCGDQSECEPGVLCEVCWEGTSREVEVAPVDLGWRQAMSALPKHERPFCSCGDWNPDERCDSHCSRAQASSDLDARDLVVADAIEVELRNRKLYQFDPVQLREAAVAAAKRVRSDLAEVEASNAEVREAADA